MTTSSVSKRIAAAVLSGVLALLASSCSLLEVSTDEPYVDPDQVTSTETFDRIIGALETDDKDAITALFSPRARRAVDFDKELETLLGFTDGDIVINDIGPAMPGMTRIDTLGDGILYEISEGWQVESDGQTFYFYVVIVSRDTKNPDNVGLKSIRAVKAGRWWRPPSSWLEGTDALGIHTEIIEPDSDQVTSNEAFNQIIDAIEIDDKDTLTAYFSPRARRAVDFDKELETLLGFTDGDIVINDIGPAMPGMVRTDTNSDGISSEISQGWQVESDGQTFYFRIIQVTRDTKNPDNVGLKSIRAVRADRQWRPPKWWWKKTDTPGIHTEIIESASDQATSNEAFDRIIDALETDDKNSLTALFSPQALRAVDFNKNFDKELETLLGFTDGEIVINDIGPAMPGMSRTDHFGDGTLSEISQGWQVESDGQTFYFYIVIVSRDTKNPDNVGVKSIRAVKADRQWRPPKWWWDGTDTEGIHTEIIESASKPTSPATPGPSPHR